MKKKFWLIIGIFAVISIIIGAHVFRDSSSTEDQYKFEQKVFHLESMSSVTVTGDLKISFFREDEGKSFRGDKAFLQQQKQAARDMPAAYRQTMYEALTYEPTSYMDTSIHLASDSILNLYSLEYIAFHQEEVCKEIGEVIKQTFTDKQIGKVAEIELTLLLDENFVDDLERLESAKLNVKKAQARPQISLKES